MNSKAQEVLTLLIGLYLILINIISFVFLGIDKFYSLNNKMRIQEKTLLALIKYGGYCGGQIGMTLFNHKTSKKTFQYHASSVKSCVYNFTLIALYYFVSNAHTLPILF